MNTCWSIEKEHRGDSIVLKLNSIQWASYELPCTSHSGGSAEDYPIEEYFDGSSLFKNVEVYFGNDVALELLSSIQNKETDERFIQERQYLTSIQNWLDSIPDEMEPPLPWRSGIEKCENIYGNAEAIAKIGIAIMNTGTTYIIKDSAFLVELATVEADTSIDFKALPEKGIRIICTRLELVIIKVVAGGYQVKMPLKDWRELWKKHNSDICDLYCYADFFLVRFKKNRIDTMKDNYLLKFNFEGHLLSKIKIIY